MLLFLAALCFILIALGIAMTSHGIANAGIILALIAVLGLIAAFFLDRRWSAAKARRAQHERQARLAELAAACAQPDFRLEVCGSSGLLACLFLLAIGVGCAGIGASGS